MSSKWIRLLASGLVLVAAIPVTLFLLDRAATEVALSLVCIALISISLYLMFGPAEKVMPSHST